MNGCLYSMSFSARHALSYNEASHLSEATVRASIKMQSINYQLVPPTSEQLSELIDIRLAAMKPSLVAIGRYDPKRAAERFANSYDPEVTMCIVVSGEIVGFYVLRTYDDHLLLDHLYLHPEAQSSGIGTSILTALKSAAAVKRMPLRLGALRESESNEFYKRNEFVKTHETDFDIHYQFTPSDCTGDS